MSSFASSYVKTVTAAVTRNADVLTYSSAGNILGTVGTVYCEASVADFSNTRRVFDLNTGGTSVPIYYQLGNGFQSFHDGTAARSAGIVGTAGVVAKLGLSYGGTEGLMSKNGTNQTAQTFDGSFGTITSLSPGGGYVAGQEIFGTIRKVRIWQRALSSSELQAVTA